MATNGTDGRGPGGWLTGRLAGVAVFGVALLTAPVATAAVTAVDGFAAALADAAAAKRPLAVLVHGASWQAASRRLAEKIWRDEGFLEAVREPFTITEIAVEQGPDEAAKKAFAERTKGWDGGSVRTFPAVQVYGPDGHLLKTVSGRQLLDAAASAESLAAAIDAVGAAARERERLREEIATKSGRGGDVSSLIDAVNKLGLLPEKDAVKRIRELDPQDRSGWAARLSFSGWDFIRGITDRIRKDETTAALDEVEGMLASEHYEAGQRCLLLAAKGMLLAALGRSEEAWQAYRLAHAWNPDGANGRAVLRHAYRTVGAELRAGPVPQEGAPPTENLSRDRARLLVVPPDPGNDRPADHGSLFAGAMKDYAFHTAAAAGAHVVIDLQDACRIDVVQVVNRGSHQDRAAGLTLWLSADGKEWREAWQAAGVQGEWTIEPGTASAPATARYLKLGLPPDRTGILHLRAVNVFGMRPGGTGEAAAFAQAPGGRLPTNTAVNLQFDPARIDMRATAAYAKSVADSPGSGAGAEDLAAAAKAVVKAFRPIAWKSVANEKVTGTALVITPQTVTIEHDGQRTVVERARFSPGSAKALETMEVQVRKFFALVAEAEARTKPQ